MSPLKFACLAQILIPHFFLRISPREHLAASSNVAGVPHGTVPPPAPQKQVEIELDYDLRPSPPPIEVTLAERRARRQAIQAKYAGGQSQVPSPSPAPQPNTAINQMPSSLMATSDPSLTKSSDTPSADKVEDNTATGTYVKS